MKLKITCRCGSEFDILATLKNRGPIVCPSCGVELPNEMSTDIKTLISAYNTLKKKMNACDLYEIQIIDSTKN
ncbi:hypothetical protein C12CBH8_14650 [Solibaculum mannosilyticum]|uniref:Uncharacterized protein n=1 Tax=Solibaculum mannosilyticum TaxID=2780922 RepID=A0A7I8D240_9FIRM|nr:hypothetical protein C12CBH8_14650 [Solibaculum mannosilyticum]